jgi:ZIP family zinc transporter
MIYLLALATTLATLLGGTLALKSVERRHVVLGLSAGLLLGMVAFDLLPEVFEIGTEELMGVPAVSIALVVGFLALHFVERLFGAHEPNDSEYGHHHEHSHAAGTLGAVALAVHVFLDGVALALAFQIGTQFGVVVSIAIFAHAFSDGLNTVSLVFNNSANRKPIYWLLGLDAVARLSGAALGTQLDLSESFVAMYLALFAGFLIYLATSHILPEAHADHPATSTMVATFVGALLMFAISSLAHSAIHGHEDASGVDVIVRDAAENAVFVNVEVEQNV